MKRFFLWMPGFVLLLTFRGEAQTGQTLPLRLPDTIGSYPLPVTERFTTNLIFPYSIFNVDLGSGDMIGKKLGKAENVLLLKANRSHFPPTNVSVYLANGALYSFRVNYVDSPSVLNYYFRNDGLLSSLLSPERPSLVLFSGTRIDTGTMEQDAHLLAKARGFLHVRASNGKVRLALKSVYLKDQLMWLSFRSRNGSLIDFQPDLLRFFLEDRKQARRTALQSVPVEPVYVPASEPLMGGMRKTWVVGFSPFTISRGKKLVVEWGEPGGDRRIRLVIKGKKLLRARNFK